jgi:endogenous inhibitor of DNA gyrase (YacG/DUF329 family)
VGRYFCNPPSKFCNFLMPRRIKLRCPICKKAVVSTAADFPFCSDHCKQIDLGKWASGAYVISSSAQDEEEIIRDNNLGNPDESD